MEQLDEDGNCVHSSSDSSQLQLQKVPVRAPHLLVNLPRYPFNHKQRYYYDVRCVNWIGTNGQPRTDLLGAPIRDSTSVSPTWKNYLTPAEVPWLLDHKVFGTLILPGAVFLAMAIEASLRMAETGETVSGYEFRDVVWHKPVIFESPDATIETITQLSPHRLGTKSLASDWTSFSVQTMDSSSSSGGQEASTNCTGLIRLRYKIATSSTSSTHVELEDVVKDEARREWEGLQRRFAEFRDAPSVDLNVENTYNKLQSHGLAFGPAFRNIVGMHAGNGWGYCELETPDTAAMMPEEYEYSLPMHPTMIDAAFQMLTCANRGGELGDAMLPSWIESLYISADVPREPGSAMRGYVTQDGRTNIRMAGTVVLSDEAWEEPMLVLKNFVVASAGSSPAAAAPKTAPARLDWVLDTRLSPLPAVPGFQFPAGLDAEAAAVAAAEAQDRAAVYYAHQHGVTREGAVLRDDVAGQNFAAMLQFVRKTEKPLDEVDRPSIAKVDVLLSARSEQGGTESFDATNAVEEVGKQLGKLCTDSELATNMLNGEFLSNFIENSMNRPLAQAVIVETLDRASYLTPNLEILEITGDFSGSPCAAAVLERLGEGKPSRRLAKYTLTAMTAEVLDVAARGLSPGPAIDFSKTLDFTGSLQDQGFQESSFDYVILDDLCLSIPNLAIALQTVKKLLRPSGSLIIQAMTKVQLRTAFVLGAHPRWWRDCHGKENGGISATDSNPASSRLDEVAWGNMLRDNGFSGVEHVFRDFDHPRLHQLSVLVSSVQREAVTYLSNDVLLIHSADESAETARTMTNLAQHLSERGFAVVTVCWDALCDLDEQQQQLAERLVISFVEFDRPVLERMTENSFLAIQNLILRCRGLLWMNRAGVISGSNLPGYSVASGLFRSVRSEGDTTRLMTLDLSQNLEPASPAAIESIFKVFSCLSCSGEPKTTDCEYAEDGGALYVQRLVEDLPLSAAAAIAADKAEPVIDRLFHEDRKLVMRIGQAGSIDSLHYADNHDFMTEPPEPTQVEVRITCTGMWFLLFSPLSSGGFSQYLSLSMFDVMASILL